MWWRRVCSSCLVKVRRLAESRPMPRRNPPRQIDDARSLPRTAGSSSLIRSRVHNVCGHYMPQDYLVDGRTLPLRDHVRSSPSPVRMVPLPGICRQGGVGEWRRAGCRQSRRWSEWSADDCGVSATDTVSGYQSDGQRGRPSVCRTPRKPRGMSEKRHYGLQCDQLNPRRGLHWDAVPYPCGLARKDLGFDGAGGDVPPLTQGL